MITLKSLPYPIPPVDAFKASDIIYTRARLRGNSICQRYQRPPPYERPPKRVRARSDAFEVQNGAAFSFEGSTVAVSGLLTLLRRDNQR